MSKPTPSKKSTSRTSCNSDSSSGPLAAAWPPRRHSSISESCQKSGSEAVCRILCSSVRDKTVYFSLGSNLGDRRKNLSNALEALEKESIRVAARSSIYETEPQDVHAQPWFLNQVAKC